MSLSTSMMTLPPGPKASDPEMGNLGDAAAAGSLHQYLTDLHLKVYKSDVISFWYGKQQVVSCCSAKAFKDIAKIFDRPPELFELFADLFTTHSITYANGEDGKYRRKFYDQAYTHNAILSYTDILNKTGDEALKEIYQIEKEFNLSKFMEKYAILANCRCSFGTFFDEFPENVTILSENYNIAWSEMEHRIYAGKPAPGSERQVKADKALQALFDLIKTVLEYRRQNPPQQGLELLFVDTLLMSQKESETDEEFEKRLLADALAFMIGGFHTSSRLITWALWYLSQNLDIQERLYEEIKGVLTDEDDFVVYQQLEDMPFLKQVYDESLRCCIITPLAARVNLESDQTICGYTIPKGMPILQPIGTAHKNPDVFPEPDNFNPEHFKKGNNLETSLAYVPFGHAGKRKCPAYRFAVFEQMMWLAKWIKRVKFCPVGENEPPPVPLILVVASPDRDLFVRPIRRT